MLLLLRHSWSDGWAIVSGVMDDIVMRYFFFPVSSLERGTRVFRGGRGRYPAGNRRANKPSGRLSSVSFSLPSSLLVPSFCAVITFQSLFVVECGSTNRGVWWTVVPSCIVLSDHATSAGGSSHIGGIRRKTWKNGSRVCSPFHPILFISYQALLLMHIQYDHLSHPLLYG